MSHEDFFPEELATRALELLRLGEIGNEFVSTTHNLTLSTGEPQAVIEGTLLIVGADLDEIARAGSAPEGDPTVEHFRRDRRLFAFLDFAEGFLDADSTRRLRPIGQEIVRHCLTLSTDDGVTAALKRISFTGLQE